MVDESSFLDPETRLFPGNMSIRVERHNVAAGAASESQRTGTDFEFADATEIAGPNQP